MEDTYREERWIAVRHQLALAETILLAGMLFFSILAALFVLRGDAIGDATSMGTAVQIKNATSANCSVSAKAGLNTVSWACITTAEPVENMMDGTSVEAMYQYLPSGNDRWKVYNPNLPTYVVSDLQFLSRRAGYLLLMDAPRNFTVQGQIVSSTNVPVSSGWSLVGYPTLETRDASNSFQSINDTLIEARTYNGTSYISYTNPGGLMNQTESGQGYWIDSSASNTWVVEE